MFIFQSINKAYTIYILCRLKESLDFITNWCGFYHCHLIYYNFVAFQRKRFLISGVISMFHYLKLFLNSNFLLWKKTCKNINSDVLQYNLCVIILHIVKTFANYSRFRFGRFGRLLALPIRRFANKSLYILWTSIVIHHFLKFQ